MSQEKKNDGGPAFPCKTQKLEHIYQDERRPTELVDVVYTGLSLRDYFAAKVMAKVMPDTVSPLSYEEHIKNAAEWSYKMADAMIKARER